MELSNGVRDSVHKRVETLMAVSVAKNVTNLPTLCMRQLVDKLPATHSPEVALSMLEGQGQREYSHRLLREFLVGIEKQQIRKVRVRKAKAFAAVADVDFQASRVWLLLNARRKEDGIEVNLLIEQRKAGRISRKKSPTVCDAETVRSIINLNFERLFSVQAIWISCTDYYDSV